MAHGVLNKRVASAGCKNGDATGKGIGSRRIFAPHFKLQVLDSYRNDADCKGNQRATARKYGIHRRQIQKWLQVEAALRSAVAGASKQRPTAAEAEAVTLNGNRQPDARVPAPTQSPPAATRWLPLDFTTHGRSGGEGGRGADSPRPRDPSAPIDLSLKRSAAAAPVCLPPSPLRLPSPGGLAHHQPDVWDLSTKTLKRKRDECCPSPSPRTSPKPVKLFKPYLDDVRDDASTTSADSAPPSVVKLEPRLPPCCSTALNQCETYYYNNNNNVCDIKSEYGAGYTLHELQPHKSGGYYYYHPAYEGGYVYDDVGYGTSALKQRQSYSLDFKLSAIDCYYQDGACKGNQRAVASKYNVHRRQVQKWLKQAEELRMRNESVKITHAVR